MSDRRVKVWMCPEHGAMTLAYPTDRTPLCHLYGVGTCDRPCELVEMAESEVIQA